MKLFELFEIQSDKKKSISVPTKPIFVNNLNHRQIISGQVMKKALKVNECVDL